MVRKNSSILICLLIVSFFSPGINSIYSQESKLNSINRQRIFLEKNVLPSDSSFTYFVSFRVPYDQLIFVKKGNGFTGGIKLDLELKDDKNIVQRFSTSKAINVANYELTASSENYIQGVINFNYTGKNFNVNPILSIDNTDISVELDSIHFNGEKIFKNGVLNPLIIEKVHSSCSGDHLFSLVNYQNAIPFSQQNYSLVVPIVDDSAGSFRVKIEQEKKIIYEAQLQPIELSGLKISECNGGLSLSESSSGKNYKYYLLPDFNLKLDEGNTRILILQNDKELADFNFRVIWHDKPQLLTNPELAIGLLEYITDKEKVKGLLKGSSDKYYDNLKKFWAETFPEKEFVFNKLMAEFYERADYAQKNFPSINIPNGAKSDRGKIYIMYGQPNEIRRDYSFEKKVLEIWEYNDLKKEFVFADDTGLGNYKLSKE